MRSPAMVRWPCGGRWPDDAAHWSLGLRGRLLQCVRLLPDGPVVINANGYHGMSVSDLDELVGCLATHRVSAACAARRRHRGVRFTGDDDAAGRAALRAGDADLGGVILAGDLNLPCPDHLHLSSTGWRLRRAPAQGRTCCSSDVSLDMYVRFDAIYASEDTLHPITAGVVDRLRGTPMDSDHRPVWARYQRRR